MPKSTLRAAAILATALLCAWLPAGAQARQTVRLSASLAPERLGGETSLGFRLRILTRAGAVPSPVTGVELSYPTDLGVATSGLGLENCQVAVLEASGLSACPYESHMGTGSAAVEIPVGPGVVRERAAVTVVRSPDIQGRFAFAFFTRGTAPVIAQFALPSVLLDAARPFGGSVDIHPPLVASLPESPDVSMTELRATIGPGHLVYHERVHGRIVGYRPRGILLPRRCPRGGFPFAVTVAFLDASRASARTVVPCPA